MNEQTPHAMPHLEQKSIFTFAAPQTSGKAKLLRRPRAPASPSRAGLSFICTLPAQKAQTRHGASCRTCCAQSQGQLSQHPWALPGWHRTGSCWVQDAELQCHQNKSQLSKHVKNKGPNTRLFLENTCYQFRIVTEAPEINYTKNMNCICCTK